MIWHHGHSNRISLRFLHWSLICQTIPHYCLTNMIFGLANVQWQTVIILSACTVVSYCMCGVDTVMLYCISRNIDSDFNLVIWRSCKDRQINLRHYQSIYTTSMGFPPYSNDIRQFKIRQQCFLSKPPNITFTNISAYMISTTITVGGDQ